MHVRPCGGGLYAPGSSELLISEVYPYNVVPEAMAPAIAHSLQCPCTDRIDLYLLHWRGTLSLVGVRDALFPAPTTAELLAML